MIQVLRNSKFYKEDLTSWITTIHDCDRLDLNRNDILNKYDTLLRQEGFFRTPVRSERPENREVTSLYSKNIVEVLRKKIALTRVQETIFQCPYVSSDTVDHPINKYYFKQVIDRIKSDVMKSKAENGTYWNGSEERYPRSFVGLIHLYRDKKATTLEANELVTYPIHD